MISVLVYLNLEGAVTFILESSFSKILEGQKFNSFLIVTLAIWTSEALGHFNCRKKLCI